jgi:hypothetical protein
MSCIVFLFYGVLCQLFDATFSLLVDHIMSAISSISSMNLIRAHIQPSRILIITSFIHVDWCTLLTEPQERVQHGEYGLLRNEESCLLYHSVVAPRVYFSVGPEVPPDIQ